MSFLEFYNKLKEVFYLTCDIISEIFKLILYIIAVVILFIIGILLYPVFLISQWIGVNRHE